MKTITCDCGFKAEHEDHYMVEGIMWMHALTDHADMLKGSTPEKMAEWLKKADAEMEI